MDPELQDERLDKGSTYVSHPKNLLGCALAALALPGLLTGCGDSRGGTTPVTNPLTNPDVILFGAGRATDASWHFYAMNPDGSGTVLVPGLSSLNAKLSQGITLNQDAAFAAVALASADGSVVERRLIRLSDGVAVYSVTTLNGQQPTVFSPNSAGGLLTVAGSPAPSDPYGIYTVSPDGTQKNRLYTLPAGPLPRGNGINEIINSPDGANIYFVMQTPQVDTAPINVLYKLGALASVPTVIADIGKPIRSLHTSRDGTKLAFVSVEQAFTSPNAAITPYTLNADGTGLTKGATITITGSFAPWDANIASRADGFHLLYAVMVNGVKQIFDVRPDGSGRTQITAGTTDSASPGSR